MTWEQLVIAVLLVLALLVQLMRALKEPVEETQDEEADAVSIPVAMTKRVPIRESRGPSETPRIEQPPMEASLTVRRRQPRVPADARDMRRGIVLMAILGPCRASDTPVFPNEPAFVRTVRRNDREVV